MRFFKKAIKAGAPVSSFDMANGLTGIDTALDKMSVHNGHVDWSSGIPKIVFYGDTSGGVPDPPEGTADWIYAGVIRKATAADVAENEDLVLNQPLISYRYIWAGPEIEYDATVPKQCPETSE